MTISRVAIVEHPEMERAELLMPRLRSLIDDAGVEVGDETPDLVLSLGGDGTMLRAARVAHAADAPLLGINLGTLGYLTEADAGDLEDAVRAVLAGEHTIEERLLLQTSLSGGEPWEDLALNEALVERTGGHRLIRLDVRISGEQLAAFNADGVIVATPTGSTAYALSAGGPIVSPRARCLVLVPVSAHMLTSRPFVLAPDDSVEISLGGRSARASVSCDGRPGPELRPDETITVRTHERPLRLVRLQGPRFLARLREKLGLPG